MSRHPHTTDQSGFDYMANQGREERDRDFCGMYIALALVVLLTLGQYWNLY